MMFEDLPKSTFEIVSPEGLVRSRTDAIATGGEIIIPDETVIIQVGDEMRRRLPNGTDEAFDVIDPVFFQETFGIPGHFQVKVRKKGIFPHGSGGNLNINVGGPNSRVNIGSHDHSINVVADRAVFNQLRSALTDQVKNDEERETLVSALARMENAKSKDELAKSYQSFIAAAADHMTVIAPFLPALGHLFGA